jgi:hypothetical protein
MKNFLVLILLTSSFYSCSKKESSSSPSEKTNDTIIQIIEESRSEVLDGDNDGIVDKRDCAPNDSSKHTLVSYNFLDQDGDGFRYPEKGNLCTGGNLPEGFFAKNEGEVDCDDLDAKKSKGRKYRFEDKDGDGHFVLNELGKTFCPDETGRIPSSIANWIEKSLDCNDDPEKNGANEFLLSYGFEDKDGDSYGVGELKTFCTNKESLPTGFASKNQDCNDQDPLNWMALEYRYVDRDGDGFTVPKIKEGEALDGDDFTIPGEIGPFYACTNGELPKGLALGSKKGLDCDDLNENIYGESCD